MLCHLRTGLRQFHNYMSSVTYYLIIGAFLATFCVYDILSFHVHVHVHISVRFHVSYQIQVSCLLHMAFQILVRYNSYPHIIQIFLSIDASNLLKNWNHSNRIIQTQVMVFSCQLVSLSILLRDSFQYSFSSALSPYLTLVLCTPLNLRC